jgi:uracil-DNA glycosylase
MKKSEVVRSMYELINLYSDFINTGFTKKYKIPDFSEYDKIPEIPQIAKTVSIEKNTTGNESVKKRKMIEIAGNIVKCTKCQINTKIKIPGAGDVSAKIFVLSYFPTLDEEKSGKPFSGETGEFFKKWMQSINVDFNSLFLTHLVKCNPGKIAVSRESIEICKTHVDEQLAVIKPAIILALGEVVLSSLCSRFVPIADNHGKKYIYNGIPFIATYHPLDVLKNPLLKKTVWEDLKKFSAFFTGTVSNAG